MSDLQLSREQQTAILDMREQSLAGLKRCWPSCHVYPHLHRVYCCKSLAARRKWRHLQEASAEPRRVSRIYEERHSLNAQAVALLVPSLYGASVPAANGNVDPDLHLCEVGKALRPVMQIIHVPHYFLVGILQH